MNSITPIRARVLTVALLMSFLMNTKRMLLVVVAGYLVMAPAVAQPTRIEAAPAQISGDALPDVDGLRAMLLAGQYDVLDQRLNAYQTSYEKNVDGERALVIAFAALHVPDPDLDPHFVQWTKAHPGSYAANLSYGIFNFAMALAWRGEKGSRDTHPEKLANMRSYLAKAEQSLERSLPLTGKPLDAYAELIRISRYGDDESRARYWLDQAIKSDPRCVEPRRAFMTTLLPNWGGGYDEMREFAAETKRNFPQPVLESLIRDLESAVKLEQSNALHLGNKQVDALSLAQEAVAMGGGIRALFLRGKIYDSLGQTDLAIKDMDQTIARNPAHSEAFYRRGMAQLVKSNVNDGMNDLRRAASGGNLDAMNQLGYMVFGGRNGIPANREEGLKWWAKTAYFRDNYALVKLGLAYAGGAGVAVDHARAEKYFRIAAEQNDGMAQNALGALLWTGKKGVPQNRDEAIRLWQLAARQGVVEAEHNQNTFLSPVERAKVAVTDLMHKIATKGLILIRALGDFLPQ